MGEKVMVDGNEVANLISSIEANHIATRVAADQGKWKSVRKWRKWRDEDYKKLQAMGIPVYNPQDDEEE